jgi:hypothetical protein
MPSIRPPPFPWLNPTVAIDPLAPDFVLFAGHPGWHTGWTHVVPGFFSNSPFSGLFCYDQANNTAAVYDTDGFGNVRLLNANSTGRTTWTYVVVGRFTDNPFYASVLLYDQGAGFAAFYSTDGAGRMTLLAEHEDWPSYTHIVVGRFSNSPRDGILLYNQGAGSGAFYSTTGNGEITLIQEHDDWRTTWTAIIPGKWGADDWTDPDQTDLFFYEGATGYGETYVISSGDITQVGAQGGFPLGARVVRGNFGGPYYLSWTNLIFFDQALSQGQVWYGAGNPVREKPVDPRDHRSFDPGPQSLTWFPSEALDLRGKAYDQVVAANFWVADGEDRNFDGGGYTDLVFYSASRGDLDFYLKEPPPQPLDQLAGVPFRQQRLPR